MYKNSQNNTNLTELTAELKKKRNEITLTALSVKHIKPDTKRKIYWGKGLIGFGIDVSTKGSKYWVYQYNIDKRCRRMNLGKFPKISLAEAFKIYASMKAKVELGIDPLLERNEEKIIDDNKISVNELSERYIDYCVVKGEISWKEKQRVFNKDILPHIGHKKAVDVTFRDVAKIINDIYVKRNKPTQAKRALSHMKCMFKYAKNFMGIVEINPCSDLELPKIKSKPKRNLNAKEIYLFWNNIDYTLMTPVVRQGLKFMLCTLARGIEVRKMKWCDIDFKERTWFIPSENAKNGREILIPLNAFAVSILDDIKKLTGHSEFVFGHHVTMNYGTLKKGYPLSVLGVTAFSHAMRDNFLLLNIEDKFTPHDLRRTSATCLTSVGYSREWVGKLLNHTPNNITSRVYDVFDYFEEKRAGTESIQYILSRILSSKSVEQVPSLRNLRREFLSKKLIYHFLDEGHYDSQERTEKGLQASSLNPEFDTLSVFHDDLKTLN